MKKIAIFLLLITPLIFNFASAGEAKYFCPMHPHYIATEPGSCPICGMDLVARGDESEEESLLVSENRGGEILYWQAPMNPDYRSDKPGKSPMGMDLVPVYSSGEKLVANIITIAPETIQNSGVRTGKAIAAWFGTSIRSYGLVTENVRAQHEISGRVSGWIEDLNVTAIGDEVTKNMQLFTMYSPDLISAQQDYIAAIKSGIKGRVSSSANRLKSLGIQDKTLSQIKASRRKLEHIPYYAEVGGIVSQLNIKKGTYIKSGTQLAIIQDYSNVWINVSVAEKDLEFLSHNMKAEVTLPNMSNEVHVARIDYIYPTIDKSSRTGQVRLVLDNQDGLLRPGAYADVVFETISEKRLAVASESILRSSDGNYVVIALGDGRFRSQKVKTGIYNKGLIQVLSGVSEGDDIVVSGQFLIDSESSLRESFRKMQRLQKPLAELTLDDDQLRSIDNLIDSSIYIAKTLISDTSIDSTMLAPALALQKHLLVSLRGTKLEFILDNAGEALVQAQQAITDAELQIALASLTSSLDLWIWGGKPSYYQEKGLTLYIDEVSGNSWIQLEGSAKNPYGDGESITKPWQDAVGSNNGMEMQGMSEGDANAGS
jgi:membrane fusion protein, copper/silver efflux system